MINLESGQKYLWQWDTGQRLILSGHPENTALDFSIDGVSAVSRPTYAEGACIVADIPDTLLKNAGILHVYGHHIVGDQVTTVLEAVYQIRSQPKPADYIDNDDDVLLWHQLDERLTRLEEAGAGGPVPYTIGTGLKLVVEGTSKTLTTDTDYIVRETINALPKYEGPHLVTPQADAASILNTNGKILLDDITVQKVPYYETSNSYGETVYIATESEVN